MGKLRKADRLCVCGHTIDQHSHGKYRSTDTSCTVCKCSQFVSKRQHRATKEQNNEQSTK